MLSTLDIPDRCSLILPASFVLNPHMVFSYSALCRVSGTCCSMLLIISLSKNGH